MTMRRHIGVVSKQVALVYECVIWGKPYGSTFCFHWTVQHMWVDRYKSTWNLVLKTLIKWEFQTKNLGNQEFRLREVGTMINV